MSGILRYGSYIPFYRLDRQAAGIGRGERAIASYDEDAVSLAVEAGREALGGSRPDTLIFATTNPPYAEKLNAAAIAAALDLAPQTRSLELGGTSRMGLSGLSLACDLAAAGRTALVCAGDVVIGAPGGARERDSGDAGRRQVRAWRCPSLSVPKPLRQSAPPIAWQRGRLAYARRRAPRRSRRRYPARGRWPVLPGQ